MANNTKYIIYARKSTDDSSRQVRSINDQIAELYDLARRENLDVIDALIEKRTAKSPGRPVFNAMLDRIEAREAEGILAWHPDRLARNSLDGGRLIYMVDTGQIRGMKFPTFSFEPTASGKLMLNMMFGQSKYYVDNLSENIKRGMRNKLKNGIWPNIAPLGYLNDRKAKTIVIDPKKAPLVKKMFEVYASGDYTLAQLREMINAMGLVGVRGATISKSSYQRMLQNPVYYGIIRFNGQFYEGIHEPLITKRLFDRVQEVMSQKSRPKSQMSKPYLYKGLFHCGECGCMITNETQKGYVYLRCTKKRRVCSQRYIREEDMTRQVGNALKSVSIPSDDADWMLDELYARQDKERSAAQAAALRVRTELSEVDTQVERLNNAYLEDLISMEEFRSTKNRLVEKRASIKERLTAIEDERVNRLEPVARFIKSSRATGFVASGDDSEEKRDKLKMIGSNRRIEDGELKFSPRGAWKLVATSGLLTNTPEPRVSTVRANLRELSNVPMEAVCPYLN